MKIRRWVKIVFFIILLFTSIFLYSRYLGPKGLKVKEYSIINNNIPESFYGIKIIHISDIHYKVTTTKSDLEEMVKEVNLLKPDIVIITGDIFDSNIKYNNKDYEDITKILKSINYNIGKYAIKGEEDLNIKNWEDIMSNSNFHNLNDTYKIIYNKSIEPILLVGISSNYKNNHIEKTLNNIYKEINEKYNYSILILHEPDFIDKIDYSKFNIILAGHSHNGQINLPFIGGLIKDKYSKKYYKEYYKLDKTKLFISSGIGTSKYKYRLFNMPSINLYRLRNN